MRARAAMLARIRAFFSEREVLEVETPLLSQAGATDPALASLCCHEACGGSAPDGRATLYLQTSPEFPMKRLLAGGVGSIYQICKVFRAGERGRLHHPEFTMLEWYRPGWTYQALMNELAELVRVVLERPALPVASMGYRDLFTDHLGVDPWTSTVADLRARAAELGIADAERLDLDHDAWLDLLLSVGLEPRLGCDTMTFVIDYPPSQAALARVQTRGEIAVAERFELYLDGIELANGFQELTDAAEQQARFIRDRERRQRRGLAAIPPDQRLLAALSAGLPAASGVAVGLDRLLMIGLGAQRIDEVLAFPIERA